MEKLGFKGCTQGCENARMFRRDMVSPPQWKMNLNVMHPDKWLQAKMISHFF